MSFPTRLRFFSLFCVALTLAALGQTTAKLQTSDTILTLEAGSASPRLASLTFPGQPTWENRASESLIAFVEISGEQAPLNWTFNREASQISKQQVAFVYDSASPHLRLTWDWRVRAPYGPIEHQIRIENLEAQEIWIPMQDSLAFNWQIDPQASLDHLFVEKGANTPSPVGTHEATLGQGYRWTGTSSTYGDLSNDQPREIIPWSLVERRDAAQSGWYVGIEFSGLTR